jgi:DNA-binding beta-propeller fold protein YncE
MLGSVLTVSPALAAPAYTLAKSTPLGAPDRWDYVTFSAEAGRVFVAHMDKVAVIDARTGALLGQVEGVSGGTHGTGVSGGFGYTDDGRNGQAVAFDLKTLKVVKTIPADMDADGIAVDKATGHVFVVEGDPAKISVVDPKTNTVVATIAGGEKMEYIAPGAPGVVYVAGEEKSDLLKVDAKANTVAARWATPDCKNPHGLAVDVAGHRAFMSCVNETMMVVDTTNGKVVAKLPIGRGSDAVAFDSKRKRVFSSNGGDGTISVYQQVSPDKYVALEPVKTEVSGRTMTVDPETGRLFVAAADTDPPAQPGGRPRPKPGTLKVLMYDPVS